MNAKIPVVLVLSPEHAQEIAGAGMDKRVLRERLFRDARLPVRALKGRGYHNPGAWPPEVDESNPDSLVPMVASPDLFWIVVAGGDGRHSSWLPAWNVCRGATEPIEES
jgi:hypothetical protein